MEIGNQSRARIESKLTLLLLSDAFICIYIMYIRLHILHTHTHSAVMMSGLTLNFVLPMMIKHTDATGKQQWPVVDYFTIHPFTQTECIYYKIIY